MISLHLPTLLPIPILNRTRPPLLAALRIFIRIRIRRAHRIVEENAALALQLPQQTRASTELPLRPLPHGAILPLSSSGGGVELLPIRRFGFGIGL